jgi:hypothetical protein
LRRQLAKDVKQAQFVFQIDFVEQALFNQRQIALGVHYSSWLVGYSTDEPLQRKKFHHLPWRQVAQHPLFKLKFVHRTQVMVGNHPLDPWVA